jgi:hypothetical protein
VANSPTQPPTIPTLNKVSRPLLEVVIFFANESSEPACPVVPHLFNKGEHLLDHSVEVFIKTITTGGRLLEKIPELLHQTPTK